MMVIRLNTGEIVAVSQGDSFFGKCTKGYVNGREVNSAYGGKIDVDETCTPSIDEVVQQLSIEAKSYYDATREMENMRKEITMLKSELDYERSKWDSVRTNIATHLLPTIANKALIFDSDEILTDYCVKSVKAADKLIKELKRDTIESIGNSNTFKRCAYYFMSMQNDNKKNEIISLISPNSYDNESSLHINCINFIKNLTEDGKIELVNQIKPYIDNDIR